MASRSCPPTFLGTRKGNGNTDPPRLMIIASSAKGNSPAGQGAAMISGKAWRRCDPEHSEGLRLDHKSLAEGGWLDEVGQRPIVGKVVEQGIERGLGGVADADAQGE